MIRHGMLVMTVILVYLKIILVGRKFQFRYMHTMFRSLHLLFWCLELNWLGVKRHLDLLSHVILEGCHSLVVPNRIILHDADKYVGGTLNQRSGTCASSSIITVFLMLGTERRSFHF